MLFIKIEDKVKAYREQGFEHGDRVIALLNNGEVKHGTLFFVEEYSTLFEVQLVIEDTTGKSVDLYNALICKVNTK
mgnify:FL=1